MTARGLGRRLLGPAFDYLLHTRPLEWPILTVHFLTGSALAVGLRGLAQPAMLRPAVLGTVAFVAGLNGGTLALNSAYDKDEGDIAFLRRPPRPPPGLALFGVLLMLGGAAVAATLPVRFLAAYALCFALSLLYSVPPIRLKAVAGMDWLINMAGFGLLTPYAGWALTGRRFAGPGVVVMVSFAFLFGALYPLTQLYQLEDDAKKGDRTLAVALGLDRSLLFAMVMAAFAFTGFLYAACHSVWGPTGATWSSAAVSPDQPRLIALNVAFLAWALVLVPWWLGRRRYSARDHQRGMHRALVAWAITDVAVLFAWAR